MTFTSKEASDAYYQKHPEKRNTAGGFYQMDATGQYVWTPSPAKTATPAATDATAPPVGTTTTPDPVVDTPAAPPPPALPGQLSPATTLALNGMNTEQIGMGRTGPNVGTNLHNQMPAPPNPQPFYPVNGRLFGGSLFGRMMKR